MCLFIVNNMKYNFFFTINQIQSFVVWETNRITEMAFVNITSGFAFIDVFENSVRLKTFEKTHDQFNAAVAAQNLFFIDAKIF